MLTFEALDLATASYPTTATFCRPRARGEARPRYSAKVHSRRPRRDTPRLLTRAKAVTKRFVQVQLGPVEKVGLSKPLE